MAWAFTDSDTGENYIDKDLEGYNDFKSQFKFYTPRFRKKMINLFGDYTYHIDKYNLNSDVFYNIGGKFNNIQDIQKLYDYNLTEDVEIIITRIFVNILLYESIGVKLILNNFFEVYYVTFNDDLKKFIDDLINDKLYNIFENSNMLEVIPSKNKLLNNFKNEIGLEE